MLEPVKLLQWLQNTDPNSQPACHHIQGKCEKQETSYHVVQNITNGPSWSNWWDVRRKSKNIESGWKHLFYSWEQTVKIFKMEAQLNILPARMYENVWHTWLQEDAHMLGLKALECTPHTKVSGFMLAASGPVHINQWGITGRNNHWQWGNAGASWQDWDQDGVHDIETHGIPPCDKFKAVTSGAIFQPWFSGMPKVCCWWTSYPEMRQSMLNVAQCCNMLDRLTEAVLPWCCHPPWQCDTPHSPDDHTGVWTVRMESAATSTTQSRPSTFRLPSIWTS